MTEQPWLWWIPLFPFLGFLVNGIACVIRRWKPGSIGDAHHPPAGSQQDVEPVGPSEDTHGHHAPPAWSGWLATAAMAGAFVVALAAFLKVTQFHGDEEPLLSTALRWIRVEGAGVPGGFWVNIPAQLAMTHLSGVMTLVVTGVGFLIHLYSIGYMAHDENVDRFFTWLNLFAAMMLLLVLGSSLPLLFVGWEGVGLCSYLLIGFWYTDEAKAIAGKKAFIVNRVGDMGFLLGMFLLFRLVMGLLQSDPGAARLAGDSTLSFNQIHSLISLLHDLPPGHPELMGLLAGAAVLLFVGACGKSAQFPLYIWLPDAMAGPTPVSALIHAATMVTAGVYMVARLSFLFDFGVAPAAAITVASVGAFTALFAATIALVQNDIKKVLAYSTVSQLGYMVLAVGVGATGTGAGIFHLVTHAFFKALLFLGAGSVIHAMEHALPGPPSVGVPPPVGLPAGGAPAPRAPMGTDPNDIRIMGGLRRRMPVTFWTFTAGTAAIVGFPLLAGYFSKDAILEAVLESPLPEGLKAVLFATGIVAAAATAFYMTRLWILTFLGRSRMPAGSESKVRESPWVMGVPLVVLAILSVVGGWVLGSWGWNLPAFVSLGSLAHAEIGAEHATAGHAVALTRSLAILAFVLGSGIAVLFYQVRPELPDRLAKSLAPLYRLLLGKYFVDEGIEAVLVRPGWQLSSGLLWEHLDVGVIDATAEGLGGAAVRGAGVVSRLQTGRVASYALGMTAAVGAIALFVIVSVR